MKTVINYLIRLLKKNKSMKQVVRVVVVGEGRLRRDATLA